MLQGGKSTKPQAGTNSAAPRASTKRSRASVDADPDLSLSPPPPLKRQLTSVSVSGAEELDLEVRVALLQSKHDALEALLQSKHDVFEADFARFGRMLRAIEDRLRSTENPSPAVRSHDTRLDEGSQRDNGDPGQHSGDSDKVPQTSDDRNNSTGNLNSGKPVRDVSSPEEKFEFQQVSSDPERRERWTPHNMFNHDAKEFFFERVWGPLKSCHHSFCDYFLPRVVPLDKIDTDTAAWMASWAPNFREYLYKYEDHDQVRTFFKACVWRILHDELFSNRCVDKWQEGAWAGFGAMLRELLPNVEHVDNQFTISFFTWKRLSVRMLHMCDRRSHSDPQRLKNIILRRLGPLIQHKEAKTTGGADQLLTKLVNIAVEADLRMLAFPWHVTLELADPETGKINGFTFKESSPYMKNAHPMSTVESESLDGRVVAFVAAPLIRIYGNTCQRGFLSLRVAPNYLLSIWGEDYHIEEVESPMFVALELEENEKRGRSIF